MSKDLRRRLTDEEISQFLNIITVNPFIPKETAESIVDRQRKDLEKQLKECTLNPKNIPKLKQIIQSQYHSSFISPGESVGVIAAQSIGERGTQTTLNSFHSAGMSIATVVTGIPRVNELLSVTKNPKMVSCSVFFTKQNSTLKELKNLIGKSIAEIKFKDLVLSWKVFSDKPSEPWYNVFSQLHNVSPNNNKNCISFKLNQQLLYENKIKLKDLTTFNDFEEVDYVIYSPDIIGQLDIFIDDLDITEDSLPENRRIFYNSPYRDVVYIEDVIVPKLLKKTLYGVEGIKNIFYRKEDSDWCIDTLGSNLVELLCLSFVNKEKTYCNNVWEIYQIFGIEAAREFLKEEFRKTFSSDIDKRHIELMVDMMTFDGNISSISRNGIKRGEVGPLCKSSFEETMENFLKAGRYGETETTNGVSASIICGKRSKTGSGLCELKMDLTKIT